MPLDLLPYGRNPIVFGTAADSPRLPHGHFLPPLIFQQQNARGYYAARLCPTKQPSRESAHGWRPCGFSRNAQTGFPSFPIILTSAFSSTSCCSCWCCCCCYRRVHTATPCDLKSLPLRTARVPTIVLPSRDFSCCTPKTTSSPRHHLWDPPPSQARPPSVILHVRRRFALAALVPSPTTPFAELCGATVAVVARSLASEASPQRNLRFPRSTV